MNEMDPINIEMVKAHEAIDANTVNPIEESKESDGVWFYQTEEEELLEAA